jgi:N-acetylglutamate synthase-like GNAT family acetyltransferase
LSSQDRLETNAVKLSLQEHGKIVGIRQVKVHKGGTREVASGFVLLEYRRQGISAQLMNELLARETAPLYTMVNQPWSPYYEKFGFRQVDPGQLPADLRKEYQIGRMITTLLSVFRKEKIRIIPTKRG